MPIKKVHNPKYWQKLKIQHPGLVSLDELKQGIWEDIQHLQEIDGAEFVEDAWLILPVVNKYGDLINIVDQEGAIVRRIKSHAYRSAAWDFQL